MWRDTALGTLAVVVLFALAFYVGTLPRLMTLLTVTIVLVLASLLGLALLLFRRR